MKKGDLLTLLNSNNKVTFSLFLKKIYLLMLIKLVNNNNFYVEIGQTFPKNFIFYILPINLTNIFLVDTPIDIKRN